MYTPEYYKNTDLAQIKQFIKANSFGILLTTKTNKITGTHIPLELEIDPNGNEVIYGHVAKANMQWQQFDDSEEVLLIFNGPHAYVSSSIYTKEDVPTWNYIAVHVYGTIKIIDKTELTYALDKLVNKYEAGYKNPVSINNLSKNTMRQINGIVGFKITITNLQATYKLSQTRCEQDQKNIIASLNKQCPFDQKIADEMTNT